MKEKEKWRDIWHRKGCEPNGRNDLLLFNGYEKTKIDMEKVVENIVSELDIKTSDRVLEVGCGVGALAQFLECDYVGVDYSKTLVSKHIEFLNNSVLVGEANNLIFKDKSFDKVICYGVFMYFENREYAFQVIEELKRVSKYGIYIGDIPIRSHSEAHHLYSTEEFEGWKITKGLYEPYQEDRFNAIIKIPYNGEGNG